MDTGANCPTHIEPARSLNDSDIVIRSFESFVEMRSELGHRFIFLQRRGHSLLVFRVAFVDESTNPVDEASSNGVDQSTNCGDEPTSIVDNSTNCVESVIYKRCR